MRYKITLILVLIICMINGFAQEINKPFYPAGSTVCFIGNSITNNGEYYNDLWLFYATRFPSEKIRFHNSGISGDVTAGVLKRMDKDVMSHKPTHAVMMIGMNDVRRELYGKEKNNDSLKNRALAIYRKNTDLAVSILKKNIENIVLIKPSIYDQTSTINTENLFGVNDALQLCGEYMSSLAKKYHTGLVDFQTIMLNINKKEQQKDPEFTIVSQDRVHPLSVGHLVMAYQFLKDTKAPKYVSKIVIGNKLNETQKNSFNVEIKNQSSENGTIRFECLENSLPYPIKETAKKALSFVNLNEEFNTELLKIEKLSPGKYDLFIDDMLISNFSEIALSKGVNLALYQHTPQYKQAIVVMNNCIKYRDKESVIRNLRFVEFSHLSGLKDQSDLGEVERYLAARLETLKSGGHYEYYQKQFKNYILNKHKEQAILNELSILADQIYMVNKPVPHTFKIVKQK